MNIRCQSSGATVDPTPQEHLINTFGTTWPVCHCPMPNSNSKWAERIKWRRKKRTKKQAKQRSNTGWGRTMNGCGKLEMVAVTSWERVVILRNIPFPSLLCFFARVPKQEAHLEFHEASSWLEDWCGIFGIIPHHHYIIPCHTQFSVRMIGASSPPLLEFKNIIFRT